MALRIRFRLSEPEKSGLVPPSASGCKQMPWEILPDSLRKGLDVVFVGTAPGHRSAEEGVYYAHPGNRFWKTLAKLGLTPEGFDAAQYRALAARGIGFTDVCKTQKGRDHAITQYDRPGLSRKIKTYRPRIVAFTSKKAASIWYARATKDIAYGRQAGRADSGPIVFVLPSPSGAASGHWQIKPWRELADLLAKRPRLSRTARSPG